MVPIDPSWFLALPLLFVLGWFSARLDRRQQRVQRQANLQPLEKAIQALAAHNPDEALKQLLLAVREAPEMLGLQRAIADLYRQKGQSDRAIEVRLSILARKSISTDMEQALLFELASDYMAAGIFDRAQASAQASLALARGNEAEPCLRLMLEIAQLRRDWAEALRLLDQLQASPSSSPLPNAPDDGLLRLRFHSLMEAGRQQEAQDLWPDHPRLKAVQTIEAAQTAAQGPHLCQACGFQTQRHYWQCPGCMSWDTLKGLGPRPMAEAKA
jgi:lipopolysaccharide biosynthesis regulator YciM